MKNDEFQSFREELYQKGMVQFDTSLVGISVYGFLLYRTREIFVILYRRGEKIGFIYEYGQMSYERQVAIYNTLPHYEKDVEAFGKKYQRKMEVLYPNDENFVFLNKNEISPSSKKRI